LTTLTRCSKPCACALPRPNAAGLDKRRHLPKTTTAANAFINPGKISKHGVYQRRQSRPSDASIIAGSQRKFAAFVTYQRVLGRIPRFVGQHLSPTSFRLARLRKDIRPFRLHFFPRLRSTNDYATLLRKQGRLFAPAIVLTGRQLAGRGRNTNTWWSGPGSLTITFVMPIDEHLSPHQLPLIAGLAVRNAVAQVTGEPGIQLKWPNDLLFRGRKLAGLLCERVHKADLIGLGLNINSSGKVPKALGDRLISLSEITRSPLDKTDVLITVVQHLYPMLSRRSEHPFGMMLREYDQHHALVGRHVTIDVGMDEPAISGACQGLDSMGRLLVQSGRGQLHRIISGQVELR
jgi:BirA family transcriptional regulator, biotin operon repressor / biotin---[acetyl-CoA-carboxylase] ligase